jgi:hypothetical protein
VAGKVGFGALIEGDLANDVRLYPSGPQNSGSISTVDFYSNEAGVRTTIKF